MFSGHLHAKKSFFFSFAIKNLECKELNSRKNQSCLNNKTTMLDPRHNTRNLGLSNPHNGNPKSTSKRPRPRRGDGDCIVWCTCELSFAFSASRCRCLASLSFCPAASRRDSSNSAPLDTLLDFPFSCIGFELLPLLEQN